MPTDEKDLSNAIEWLKRNPAEAGSLLGGREIGTRYDGATGPRPSDMTAH